MTYSLQLAHLYPDQMNIYGDRGNIITLQYRCRARGIDLTVLPVDVAQIVDWQSCDLAFFGGGQDSGQALIAKDFVEHQGKSLAAAIEDDLVLLAICGGFQLLGHYFLTHTGERLPGIGAIDVYTLGGTKRLIGNSVVAWQQPQPDGSSKEVKLVGFENHSGRTYLGSGAHSLGKTLVGSGNNGEDGSGGAVYRNTYGCYLHGSMLPKNPQFADHLIDLALRRRYGDAAPVLAPLDDRLELQAQRSMVERLT
jgi:CobQ-like glutamine amidotransferase family enzyme